MFESEYSTAGFNSDLEMSQAEYNIAIKLLGVSFSPYLRCELQQSGLLTIKYHGQLFFNCHDWKKYF